MTKYKLLLSVMLMSTLGLWAQKEVVTQQNTWYDVVANLRLSEDWSISGLYSWRREGLGERWQQSLLRVGATRSLASGPKITLGYDWVVTYPYGEQPAPYHFIEHRPFQQLVAKQKAARLSFTHRYRLEQRFLELKSLNEQAEFETAKYIFRQRARYRLTLAMPLNATEVKKGTVLLTAFNEVFVNFGKGTGQNLLDQNWLSAGLQYVLSDATQLSVGYMNQYLIKGDGIQVERNHTVLVGLRVNLETKTQQE